MESENEDLDSLVFAQVGMMTARVTAMPAPSSDEELDALIHEALTGVTIAPGNGEMRAASATTSPQQQQRVPQNQVLSATVSPGVGVRKTVGKSAPHRPIVRTEPASSSDSSNADSEAMLQAVLEGCGLPAPNSLTMPLPQRHQATAALESQIPAKEEAEDEDETILMGTLLHLACPPSELVSEIQRQGDEAEPQDTPSKMSAAQTTTTTVLPASNSVIYDNSDTRSGTTTALAVANGDGRTPQAASENENRTQFLLCSPASQRIGEGPVPSKPSLEAPDMEDEKQILTAILNAVQDRQSSVSGELVYGDDDHNVDAVLQQAEQIAVSSLREEQGRVNRILHLHEHIEMREELRKARGSVGWPSCLSAPTTPVMIGVDPSNGSVPALPSSAVKRPILCIGTTLGILLLFDAKKKLCGMCGSVADSSVEMQGAVVSLSMSFDASTVLSGHERGALVLWDTDTLSPLRKILDEFTTPITQLRHCYMDPFKVILLSSCGRVKLLSFTRILSKTMYRMTHIAASVHEAPFNDMDIAFMKEERLYLVAAVSADALLVSALECGLTSVATPFNRRSQPSTSSLSLQLVHFLSNSVENGVLLCVAWGVDFEIFSVAVGGKLTNLHRLTGVRLEKPLHAMSPIADGCLLLLDQKDVLHLLDAGVGVIVETRVLHGVEPVVFSTRSCGTRHNAALTFMGNEAILLGRRRIFTCTLLSWQARLDALVEKRCFLEALELAKAFALEVALAVVGLHGDSATRRASIHSYIFRLVTSYLIDITSRDASQEAIRDCITSIIQFCSEIDAMDVFFGPAMDFLRRDAANYSLALYCLEKCILSGVVTVLPDVYIQPFLDLFANETSSTMREAERETSDDATFSGGVLRAERVLMCLESNEELLMRIAEQHNLVRLAVSILSSRQHRYADALRFALEKDHDNGVAVCFFECTMEGYTISEDVELPVEQRQEAKRQLWSHLLTFTDDFVALLRMDPERVLSAMLLSLQESGPDSPWGGYIVKAAVCQAVVSSADGGRSLLWYAAQTMGTGTTSVAAVFCGTSTLYWHHPSCAERVLGAPPSSTVLRACVFAFHL
ncbi:hypothetical protein TraAM80_06066 [Trypanosoma rangeli]|uniref:Vacuolar protein sorting-associated protein 8 central domain-containing protein n=1 Tax=Trypanosoma rangeli TaxID=5698 RepID=A0A3R7NIC2_TRYRA|nr:uncharacterized protein TraAM80_06066 [Trypanosoma rangeli]RNF03060.1 hypothetical protein TraAM80_06066 [Trypanosoma rangeli]|eukprot:RNF03060.1 hypothetical protein TraAM80_06066 [Trypanosoma rangeli]